MSIATIHDFLYLIWKDPKTRRNFTVGKLTRDKKYYFEYCEENEAARENGWRELEAFPENKVYESQTLFPVFSSRLPDPKRRDIEKILQKYKLDIYDEYELLKKSGARLPIDTYELIDPIFPEQEFIEREFFIMGIRHVCPCDGNECDLLPLVSIGDEVKLQHELDNPNDSKAILVTTSSGEKLGYIPRYYNQSIFEKLSQNISYICTVTEKNSKSDNCSECVKVRLQIPKR